MIFQINFVLGFKTLTENANFDYNESGINSVFLAQSTIIVNITKYTKQSYTRIYRAVTSLFCDPQPHLFLQQKKTKKQKKNEILRQVETLKYII